MVTAAKEGDGDTSRVLTAVRHRVEVLEAKFDGFAVDVRDRFDKQDLRVTALDVKLDRFMDETEARFAAVDRRFDQVDARFNQVDARFDRLETRFGQFEDRLDRLETRFGQFESGFDAMNVKFGLVIDLLARALGVTLGAPLPPSRGAAELN